MVITCKSCKVHCVAVTWPGSHEIKIQCPKCNEVVVKVIAVKWTRK